MQYHPVSADASEISPQLRHHHLLHLVFEAANVLGGICAVGIALHAETTTTIILLTSMIALLLQIALSALIFARALIPKNSNGCLGSYAAPQLMDDWRIYHHVIFTANILCTVGLTFGADAPVNVIALLVITMLRALIYIPLIVVKEDAANKTDATGEVFFEDEVSRRRQFHRYLLASGIDLVCLIMLFMLSSAFETHFWAVSAVTFFSAVCHAMHAFYLNKQPDSAVLAPALVFSVEAFVANAGLWIALILWPLQY